MSRIILYLIISTLFLEADIFSFDLFGARIRISQVAGVAAILYVLALIAFRKLKLRTTSIDLPLWCYVAINIVAIGFAYWVPRGVKLSVLLLSLVLLYYAVTMLLSLKNNFNKSFKLLLLVGLAEIGYGLYQVAAGVLNSQLGMQLPIGHLGAIHKEFIGSVWGRPYGTFVEPDWYGTICMYFALLFAALNYSRLTKSKVFYRFGMVLSLTGLFLSFVRSAWVGFAAGAVFMLFYKYKNKLSEINIRLYLKKISLAVLVIAAAVLFIKPLQTILVQRFFTSYLGAAVSVENVRAQQMIVSFKSFLNSPIIGNGPGSSAFNYTSAGKEQGAGYAVNADMDRLDNKGFNPNILLTVLEDTGIAGFGVFMLFLYRFVRYNNQSMVLIKNEYSVITFGLYSGLVGLFVSYLFSQGMWIPFTWVFIAFNIGAIHKGQE